MSIREAQTAVEPQAVTSQSATATLHPFTQLQDFASGKAPSTVITGGKGVRISDAEGRSYIDAFAGLYCVNIGYGRPEVAEAISRQAHELAYYHSYVGHTTEQLMRLSSRLVEMAPGRMSRVFYGLSGSDANETQAKMVWYYHNLIGKPEKKKIISRERGYHGSSVVSGSMTGLSFYHDHMDLPMALVKHTGVPHYWRGAEPGESEADFSRRRAAELEELILREGPDTVGGFIGEPVLGTGGLTPPPEGYWDEIQKVLRKYDVLLIADEVITGFGRTGAMFGSDLYGMEPDLVTVAKGLTSAYAPLSGAIVGERMYQVMEDAAPRVGPFSHGYTYTGHPLGAAAANAVLDIVESENLPGRASEVGNYMFERLKDAFADSPIVGEVRGVGLMAAVEFAPGKDAQRHFDPDLKVGPRIAASARERGLIARALPHGDILGFSPPLVITREEVDEVVDVAAAAHAQVLDELTREGALG